MYIKATAIFRDIFQRLLKNMTIGSRKNALIAANINGIDTGIIK